MNKHQKLGILQGLLERVKKNARAPRVRAPHPAPEAEPALEVGGGIVQAEEQAGLASGVQVVTIAEDVSRADIEVLDEVVLLEDEIVELTPEPPMVSGAEAVQRTGEPAILAGADVDLDFEGVEDLTSQPQEVEEVPASSRRPKAATSMDEALAEAAEQHEVPIQTPPPESGPQAAMPAMAAPPAPEVDELLEPSSEPPGLGLARGLALDEPLAEAPAPQPAAPLEPEVTRRPPLASGVEIATYERSAQEFKPATFVELLDASLGLGS